MKDDLELTVRGPLAEHPLARDFVQEVARVHRRYADEVVGAYGLCPFFRDAHTSFGAFCVMLEHTPTLETAREAFEALGASVVHIVYPCARPDPTLFERFASKFGEHLKASLPRAKAPVLASFHPEMPGDKGAPYRMVGLLRRAPDPFIQLIPEGLHQGGTVFAGGDVEPTLDPAEKNFRKLKGMPIEELVARVADIHADRDRSYARFAELTTPGP